MNTRKFFDSLGEVDEKYIAEAASYHKNKRGRKYIFALAAAACLLLAVIAGGKLLPESVTDAALPMVEAEEAEIIQDTERTHIPGHWLYDFSEYGLESPWAEDMNLTTLPVYKNLSYHRAGTPIGLTEEEMTERFLKAVDAMDIEIGSRSAVIESYPDYLDDMKEKEAVTHITGNNGEIEVTVYANGLTEIRFLKPLKLPEEYSFTYSSTTAEEAEKTLEYLSAEYSSLLSYSEPAYYSTCTYGIESEYADDEGTISRSYPVADRSYYAYDASGSDKEKILNHDFRCTQFIPDENGNLWYIRVYDGLSTVEKLGDYPLISLSEAYDKLKAGKSVIAGSDTTFPVTDMETVKGVELSYRYNVTDKYYLPYYLFWVETGEWDFGLKTYTPMYVAAIEDRYITGVETYDGHIN